MKRRLCIGGCGREVLKALGAECRKCRKARRRAGLKRVVRAERGSAPSGGKRVRH